MATSPKLQRFKEAMRMVYGNFDSPPSPFLRAMASASSSSSLSSLPGMSAASQPTPKPTKSRSSTLTPPSTPLPPWSETWNPPSFPGAGGHRGRYLWTDAFGLLNFLTLCHASQNQLYLTLAKRLVHRVHEVLGREREPPPGASPDATPNRLPGATDAEPLKGGLRIGKLNGSGPDGDGQYHHYLTLWAYGLCQLSVVSGEEEWVLLAAQLMKAIHRHFVIDRGGYLRLVWKVSTDMKHVLVPSTGHLDAVTGLAVVREIKTVTEKLGRKKRGLEVDLDREEEEYIELVAREVDEGYGKGGAFKPLADPLDLGMGLWVTTLPGVRDESWAQSYAQKAMDVTRVMLGEEGGLLQKDSGQRYAYREFGTVLGLKCYLGEDAQEDKEKQYFLQKASSVVEFWEEFIRKSEDETFEPISLVMYAASLIPGAFKSGFFEFVPGGAEGVV